MKNMGYDNRDIEKVQRVEEVSGDEYEESTPQIASEPSPISTFAALSSVLRKIFSIFSGQGSLSEGRMELGKELSLEVATFLSLLKELQQNDMSKSADFSERLSSSWSHLTHLLGALQRTGSGTLLNVELLKNVVDQIKTYPSDAVHTLGYYLTAHTGSEWLPFPYIDMLLALHVKGDSPLSDWISSLEKVTRES